VLPLKLPSTVEIINARTLLRCNGNSFILMELEKLWMIETNAY
jgi:hypothetical protein